METIFPAVTVIIPMRNEERRIGRCLESILANDFPHEQMEILVADGMSSDRSAEIVADFATRFLFIHLLENGDRIVSAGLNLGIRQARGEVIFIVGAHSEYPRNYLSTCVRELRATHADVVGGMLRTRPGADTLVAQAVALMTQHPFGVGLSAFRTRSTGRYVDTVPYGAYRREVFERVGLFRETLARNQDFELNARIRNAGGKLFLSADLEIDYYNAPDFRQLVAQAFNNGRWLARMWLVSPASFRVRHAVPLAFVSVLLVCAMLGLATVAAAQLAMLVLVAYATGATLAGIQICRREGARFFLPLIGLFFTHHFAYGLGTVTGVLISATEVFRHEALVHPSSDSACENHSITSMKTSGRFDN